MPHDHDEFDEDSPHGDIYEWLRHQMHRSRRRPEPNGRDAWPAVKPTDPQSRSRMLPALALVVLVALAGLAVALGLRNQPPEPSYALTTKRPVRVYTAPSSDSAPVTILAPGERVLATEPISRRWGTVFEPDSDRIGYAYESDENFEPARDDKAAPEPTDTTAICKDGWISHSKHASGTCSWHGGVARWVHHPES